MADSADSESIPRNTHQALASMPAKNTRNQLRSKARLALPQLLVLLTGFVYIITACILLSTSLRGVAGAFDIRIRDANVELEDLEILDWAEDELESRMCNLEEAQLHSEPYESYETCLVRGINQVYFQVRTHGGFEYPTLRHRGIDWTVENCGRLHHSLQVDQPSEQQDVLNGWARISYRGRRLAEKAIWLVAQFSKTGASVFRSAEPIVPIVPIVEQPPTCKALSARYIKVLPDGFHLDGEASPCRLVYVPSQKAPIDKAEMDKYALSESELKLQWLIRNRADIGTVLRMTAFVAALMKPLTIFCLALYVLSMFASVSAPTSTTPGGWIYTFATAMRFHRFTGQVQCAAVYDFAHVHAIKIDKCTDIRLYIAMIICSMTLLLYTSCVGIGNIRQMHRALTQLFRIAKELDALIDQAFIQQPRTGNNDGHGQDNDAQKANAQETNGEDGNVGETNGDYSNAQEVNFQESDTKDSNNLDRLDEGIVRVPSREPTFSVSSSLTELRTMGGTRPEDLAANPQDETHSLHQSDTDSDSPSGDEGYVDLGRDTDPNISDNSKWAVVDT